jgi:ABC-type sugar transport system, periplasmic component
MMNLIVKKVIPFLLAAGMLLGTTACGSPSSSGGASAAPGAGSAAAPGKVTLTYWHIMTDEPGKSMITNIVNKWNTDHPDIQIQASATANDPYKTKIKTAIAANEAPDIIYSWTEGFAQPFVEAGKILCLDSYLDSSVKDQMLPGALDNVTFDGKVYGLTYAQQASGLYVNTELFDKYHVKIPTTFDELLTAIKTFKENGILPLALGNKDEWPGMWLYDMLALREGGADLSISALENKSSFTDPAFVNAGSKLLDLVDAGSFDSGVMGLTADEANASFAQGKAAMVYGGNFWAQFYEADSSAVKDKVKVVRFPTIEGGKGDPTEYVGGGSDALLINANSKYKEQAVKAAEYLAQQNSTQAYLLGAGLPEWKYDGVDTSHIDKLTQEFMSDIISGSKGSVPAWDIFLTGDKAQAHKDMVAQLFGKTTTAENFAKDMQSKLSGQ